MKKTKVRLTLCLVLLLLNLALIWGSSLQTAEQSSKVSVTVAKPLAEAFPEGEFEAEGVGHAALRKTGHLTEFLALGLCTGWLACMLCPKDWQMLLLPLVCGTAVAALDEIIQLSVPGRSGQLSDVGIDVLGLCFGIVLINIIRKRKLFFGGTKQ